MRISISRDWLSLLNKVRVPESARALVVSVHCIGESGFWGVRPFYPNRPPLATPICPATAKVQNNDGFVHGNCHADMPVFQRWLPP